MKNIIASLLSISLFTTGQTADSPFDYDLHIVSLVGENNRTMICFHGYGDNYHIAADLKNRGYTQATLIGFNFPEYDIKQGRPYDPRTATFGTIDELLPALYVMKKIVIEEELTSIDLYGFSAGGGALINAIGALNTSVYDTRLKEIGIGPLEKKSLIAAIENGLVVLDTPLKSVEEIIDYRGTAEELEILAKHYLENGMRPIDTIEHLKGLSLNILLYFQENDDVLSNRDDSIYIEKLMANVNGNIEVVIGKEGTHNSPHPILWKSYTQHTQKRSLCQPIQYRSN